MIGATLPKCKGRRCATYSGTMRFKNYVLIMYVCVIAMLNAAPCFLIQQDHGSSFYFMPAIDICMRACIGRSGIQYVRKICA